MELQETISNFVITSFIVLSTGVVLYAVAGTTRERAQDWLARCGLFGRRDSRGRLSRFNLLLIGGSLSRLDRKLRPMSRHAGHKLYQAVVDTVMQHTGRKPRARPPSFERSERRQDRRFRTGFLGTLHPSAEALAVNLCDILDISASGARIRPVDRMPPASQVTLGLERFGLFPARVVWQRDGEIGLNFEQEPNQIVRMMRGLLPIPTHAH